MQTTEEEGLFEFEHEKYDGLLLRGENRRLGSKAGSEKHWSLTLYYRTELLSKIVNYADAWEPVHERAVVWMEDHPGLAGFRVNDGVEEEGAEARTYQMWQEAERVEAVEDLKEWGFDEGDYFYHSDKEGIYQVTELSPDGLVARPVKEKVQHVYGAYSTYLGNIAWNVDQGVVETVPKAIVDDPLRVVLRYAEIGVSEQLQTLGSSHEFNRIDEVEKVGDLRAALFLGRAEAKE